MSTILIIEDEPDLARILRSYLEKASYRVYSALNGRQGLSLWSQVKPDLVLLDLNLPEIDGLEVARTIRQRTDTPIIMVTARIEETDRLVGLEIGADDYITKPFSPREVVARVRAVLRRASGPTQVTRVLRVGPLTIDMEAYTVQRDGQFLELTPTEFSLLGTLAGQPGRVFSRAQLLEKAQGNTFEGYERTVDAHIKNLRAKIEPDPKHPTYIHTVFGVGYRFDVE